MATLWLTSCYRHMSSGSQSDPMRISSTAPSSHPNVGSSVSRKTKIATEVMQKLCSPQTNDNHCNIVNCFILLQRCPCLQWPQRATMPSLLMPTPPTQSAPNQSKNSPRPALQPVTTARVWVSVHVPECIHRRIALRVTQQNHCHGDYKLTCCL